jgi:hypothetical protein
MELVALPEASDQQILLTPVKDNLLPKHVSGTEHMQRGRATVPLGVENSGHDISRRYVLVRVTLQLSNAIAGS